MKKIIIACILFSLSGCKCGSEDLFQSCPPPEQLDKPCVGAPDDLWFEVNNTLVDWNIGDNSSCKLGTTMCDEETKEVYCEGHKGIEDEVCDGIDNNCNFVVDDATDLLSDNRLNDCNQNGVCAGTVKSCVNGAYQCISLNEPRDEVCNGVDDDCDGVIDDIEPVECWTGPSDSEFGGASQCVTGLVSCVDGSLTSCQNQTLPSGELCDFIDNNCDGLPDNDVYDDSDFCGAATNAGQCVPGRKVCTGGETLCVNTITPQNESCDNVDNDCDSFVDEGLYRPCESICGVGLEFCEEGNWIGCTALQPSVEICDQVDNDCDGTIDEGCPCIHTDTQLCITNLVDSSGVLLPFQCGSGVQVCEFGEWQECWSTGATAETCNNWDDDCDGMVDNFTKVCGDESKDGVGECRVGASLCTAGEWTGCIGSVDPKVEVCDGLDNDCDTEIDEGLERHEKVDMVFIVDVSGSMCPYTQALSQGIAGYVAAFQGTEHKFSLITYPNGEDNEARIVTFPSLTDVGSFSAAMSVLGCFGGGEEPTYDVLKDVTDPLDPMDIGWRHDAHPYVVLITDEGPATSEERGVFESDIAEQTINCEVGDCQPGDVLNFFVITKLSYRYGYDTIVEAGTENERIISIVPADGNRYREILRNIFQEVCVF